MFHHQISYIWGAICLGNKIPEHSGFTLYATNKVSRNLFDESLMLRTWKVERIFCSAGIPCDQ